MLIALNYISILIYGLLIMAFLLNIKMNRKNMLFLSVYVVLSSLLQFVLFSTYGSSFIEKSYPIIIHLPLILLFRWIYKKRLIAIFFVLLNAYALTTPRKWIGDVVASFFDYDLSLSIIVQIISSPILLLITYRYLRPFVIRILEYKGKHIFLLSIMPGIYYLVTYASTVYTKELYRSDILLPGLLGIGFNLCFYIFMAAYFDEMTKSFDARTQQTVLQMQIDATTMQIEDYKASQNQAAIYRHDLRHHLHYLSNCISENHTDEAQAYITRINNDTEAAPVTNYCENTSVNLILSAYAAQAKNRNISIEIYAVVPILIPMQSTDICVILGNGIENAIHACAKIEDPGKKEITVECRLENTKLIIEICNPFSGVINFDGDVPVSLEENHGFGVKSIVAATQKYQGLYSFTAENGIFTLRVIL
ncbi:GHKL domain-containing protein [bacterium]|nr:GHKL domain-containing protein [bacterium]